MRQTPYRRHFGSVLQVDNVILPPCGRQFLGFLKDSRDLRHDQFVYSLAGLSKLFLFGSNLRLQYQISSFECVESGARAGICLRMHTTLCLPRPKIPSQYTMLPGLRVVLLLVQQRRLDRRFIRRFRTVERLSGLAIGTANLYFCLCVLHGRLYFGLCQT